MLSKQRKGGILLYFPPFHFKRINKNKIAMAFACVYHPINMDGKLK